MLRCSAALLLALNLYLSSSQDTANEDSCSHGDLVYLCDNFDTCSQYGLIDEASRKTMCAPQQDKQASILPTTTFLPPTTSPSHRPEQTELPSQKSTLPPSTSYVKVQYTGSLSLFTSDTGVETVAITTSDPDIETPDSTTDPGLQNTDSTSDPGLQHPDSTSEPGIRTAASVSGFGLQTADFTSDTGIETKGSSDFTTQVRPSTRDSFTFTSRRRGFTVQTTEESTTEESTTELTTELPTEEHGIAPTIRRPPVNITVPPGGTAQFGCKADGAPTPQTTITKREETTPLPLEAFPPARTNIISETTIIQQMDNIVKSNEGWYTCMACNHYGCSNHDAYLHVLDLCKGVTCPEPLYCQGDYDHLDYSCQCPDFCETSDLMIPDFVCTNRCENKFNECQMLTEACANGQFDVEVAYKGYCERTYDPEISLEISTSGVMNLSEGDTLVLQCYATGTPQPTISWYKEGDSEPVGVGEVYEKVNVALDDAGVYYCEAVNCKNDGTKARGEITDVFVDPIITTPPTTPPITTSYDNNPDNIIIDNPRSTCQVFGDPHFYTYDLNAYDFMGTCDYVLAMDCQMAKWFVYGRMRPCGRNEGSCLETVTVYFNSEILELQRGWLVNHYGRKISPKNYPNEDILVQGDRHNATLFFDGAILTLTVVLKETETFPGTFERDSIVIRWDGYVSVSIQTPRSGKTCGMCGDNDGDASNDMRTRRRRYTDDAVEFGDSWKIDRYDKCESAPEALTLEEACGDELVNVTAECERIFSIAPFQHCDTNLNHSRTEFIQACIYDECQGIMQQPGLPPKCIVAQAYATRCSNQFWIRSDEYPRSYNALANGGWEAEAGCPTSEERFQPILDTGCPQEEASLHEEEEEAA